MPATTRALADFAAGLTYEAIPAEAIRAIKKTLLDALGCGLVGGLEPPASVIADLVVEIGGRAEATLWLRGCQAPAANVALALGPMIHAHGFDDVHTKLHVASVVVPAAVTVAEREQASGRELLTAMVAGYEVMVRIGQGLNTTRSFLRGWRVTGTCGTFGAAAAAGRLIGLDGEWMAAGLGLAGNQSAGLFTTATTNSVNLRFDPGRAAQSGVLAADLARRGVGGSDTIIEAEHGGFYRAMSDDYDLERVTAGLGERFVLGSMQNKLNPVPISLMSGLEAARTLKREHRVEPDQIEEIVLRSSQAVIRECGYPFEPTGPLPSQQLRGQLAAAYVLPVVFVDGDFTMDHFRPDKLSDPRINALGKRVRTELHPELDRRYPELLGNEVAVRLRDGQTLVRRVDNPRGTAASPLTFDDVAGKFVDLAERAGKGALAQDIVGSVDRLEQLADTRSFARLLA